MTTHVTSVMVSVAGRERVRARTLSQLAARWQPRVFQAEDVPPGRKNAHLTAQAALHHALLLDAPYTLYLEDDLDFAPAFDAVVDAVTAQDHYAVALFLCGLRFYPAPVRRAIETGHRYPPGLYRVVSARAFYGSQALLLSRRAVANILDDWHLTGYGTDFLDCRVGAVCADRPGSFFVYAPNPVQHYGAVLRSTWSRGHRVSGICSATFEGAQ